MLLRGRGGDARSPQRLERLRLLSQLREDLVERQQLARASVILIQDLIERVRLHALQGWIREPNQERAGRSELERPDFSCVAPAHAQTV